MHSPPESEDQVARFRKELKDGKWLSGAHQRSRRRKSAWNFLLLTTAIPLCGVFAWLMITAVWAAHLAFHPDLAGAARHLPAHLTAASALMVIPSLFCCAGPGAGGIQFSRLPHSTGTSRHGQGRPRF